jgi:hypothetical protein
LEQPGSFETMKCYVHLCRQHFDARLAPKIPTNLRTVRLSAEATYASENYFINEGQSADRWLSQEYRAKAAGAAGLNIRVAIICGRHLLQYLVCDELSRRNILKGVSARDDSKQCSQPGNKGTSENRDGRYPENKRKTGVTSGVGRGRHQQHGAR